MKKRLIITYNKDEEGRPPQTVILIENEDGSEQELLWSEEYYMSIEIDNRGMI